jgi:hydroxymethylpyrimidine pyrophosphatase-like HAD family hydrolase
MHFGETSKQHGIRLMRQKIPWTYEKEIFMIGDSHYDFLHPETKHLGVSNAAGKFKEKCDFVAEHDHAHGVIDCLDWILKH